jgi:hypothetical protein
MAEVPDFAGLLSEASREFTALKIVPELGAVIGYAGAGLWAEERLLIWVCDFGQAQVRVLKEVAGLVRLSAERRLGRVWERRPSLELVNLLARTIAQAVWGLAHLRRELTAGDARAAANITKLRPAGIEELQRDLELGRITGAQNPEDEKDLRQVAMTAAVEREWMLRKEHSALLVRWITEHGLELPYPEVDGQSTRLDPERWPEKMLLTGLTDLVSRMALPHSAKAGYLRRAGRWAIADELKRRGTQKRGAGSIEQPFDDALLEGVDERISYLGVLELVKRRMDDKAFDYFTGIAKGLSHKEAAAEAKISVSTGGRLQQRLAVLLRKEIFRR